MSEITTLRSSINEIDGMSLGYHYMTRRNRVNWDAVKQYADQRFSALETLDANLEAYRELVDLVFLENMPVIQCCIKRYADRIMNGRHSDSVRGGDVSLCYDMPALLFERGHANVIIGATVPVPEDDYEFEHRHKKMLADFFAGCGERDYLFHKTGFVSSDFKTSCGLVDYLEDGYVSAEFMMFWRIYTDRRHEGGWTKLWG